MANSHPFKLHSIDFNIFLPAFFLTSSISTFDTNQNPMASSAGPEFAPDTLHENKVSGQMKAGEVEG